MPAPAVTIDQALEAFLDAQRERLAPRTFARYEDVVELLRASLDSYGPNGLDAADRARWERAYEAGEEGAFCRTFGPELIPEHLDEFLGWYLVRKVIAGEDLLRRAATVVARLVAFLHGRGWITEQQRSEAAELAADARQELPRAERLATLLHEAADRAPPFDPDALSDRDVVDDLLVLERVEPGALWFEGGIGPVAVPRAASGLARPGWAVNAMLVRLGGRWRLVEVGSAHT